VVADFSRFLRSELVPFIAARYRVSPEPARTVLGGQSLGGLAAMCAGLAHPEAFGLLLVQSGSFWWKPTGTPGATAQAESCCQAPVCSRSTATPCSGLT
jgi:enterochelin esterase-like enzyme